MIDITFDFRSDTPPGKDPDTFSPTLCRYHQILWSKPLPTGELFELEVTGPPYYLHHRSELGEFLLSSDAVVPSFSWLASIVDQIPEVERDEFKRIGYTIGGMMVFPAQRVAGKMTINGARGWHPRIKDRFDLTVECIRRHYVEEPSPLSDTLARYADFFGLFGDFAGYVDFFHLQDLVNEDASTVRFFTPFADFTASPLPATVDAYLGYRQHAIEFIESRNRRIADCLAAGADPLEHIWQPEKRAPGRTHSPTIRGSSCVLSPMADRPVGRSAEQAKRDRQLLAPTGGVRADPTAAASFKTAKARLGPSVPAKELTPFIKSVLAESPRDPSLRDVLDYGCGRGADVGYFRSLGIDANGYDPHLPFGFGESPAGLFTVVTLIFVLNVLSTEEARREAIREAAAHLATKGALIVATRSTATIQSAADRNGWRGSGDGFLSLRGTFQHGMDAAEIVGLGEMIGLQRRPICPPANVRDAALVALARRTPTPGNA
jgi:hypothetical protein